MNLMSTNGIVVTGDFDEEPNLPGGSLGTLPTQMVEKAPLGLVTGSGL
jgi:hypothetical protein